MPHIVRVNPYEWLPEKDFLSAPTLNLVLRANGQIFQGLITKYLTNWRKIFFGSRVEWG